MYKRQAYINDHKKQRSLLLARSTLEYSNKLLHEYSCKEVGGYKELNIDLDRYTRAFDVIDVMYQSLRTVLNVKNTYTSVSDRIGDYKSLLEDFNAKILKRGRIESADTLIISINARGLRAIAREGEQLYKSVSDLVLYATCLLYTSMNNEEQDVKKKIMMVVGACIFLIAAAKALPLFFGIAA